MNESRKHLTKVVVEVVGLGVYAFQITIGKLVRESSFYDFVFPIATVIRGFFMHDPNPAAHFIHTTSVFRTIVDNGGVNGGVCCSKVACVVEERTLAKWAVEVKGSFMDISGFVTRRCIDISGNIFKIFIPGVISCFHKSIPMPDWRECYLAARLICESQRVVAWVETLQIN